MHKEKVVLYGRDANTLFLLSCIPGYLRRHLSEEDLKSLKDLLHFEVQIIKKPSEGIRLLK